MVYLRDRPATTPDIKVVSPSASEPKEMDLGKNGVNPNQGDGNNASPMVHPEFSSVYGTSIPKHVRNYPSSSQSHLMSPGASFLGQQSQSQVPAFSGRTSGQNHNYHAQSHSSSYSSYESTDNHLHNHHHHHHHHHPYNPSTLLTDANPSPFSADLPSSYDMRERESYLEKIGHGHGNAEPSDHSHSSSTKSVVVSIPSVVDVFNSDSKGEATYKPDDTFYEVRVDILEQAGFFTETVVKRLRWAHILKFPPHVRRVAPTDSELIDFPESGFLASLAMLGTVHTDLVERRRGQIITFLQQLADSSNILLRKLFEIIVGLYSPSERKRDGVWRRRLPSTTVAPAREASYDPSHDLSFFAEDLRPTSDDDGERDDVVAGDEHECGDDDDDDDDDDDLDNPNDEECDINAYYRSDNDDGNGENDAGPRGEIAVNAGDVDRAADSDYVNGDGPTRESTPDSLVGVDLQLRNTLSEDELIEEGLPFRLDDDFHTDHTIGESPLDRTWPCISPPSPTAQTRRGSRRHARRHSDDFIPQPRDSHDHDENGGGDDSADLRQSLTDGPATVCLSDLLAADKKTRRRNTTTDIKNKKNSKNKNTVEKSTHNRSRNTKSKSRKKASKPVPMSHRDNRVEESPEEERARQRREDAVELMVEEKRILNELFLCAVANGRRADVATLVQRGAVVNKFRELHHALLNGAMMMDDPFIDGAAALHLAVAAGHFEVVKFLLETKECDPNLTHGRSSQTPIFMPFNRVAREHALLRGSPSRDSTSSRVKMLELLLKYNADPCVRDGQGALPIHYCARFGTVEEADMMFEAAGGRLHIDFPAGRSRQTPLMLAASSDNLVMVKYFIANGANQDLLASNGLSALDVAGPRTRLELMTKRVRCPVCGTNCPLVAGQVEDPISMTLFTEPPSKFGTKTGPAVRMCTACGFIMLFLQPDSLVSLQPSIVTEEDPNFGEGLGGHGGGSGGGILRGSTGGTAVRQSSSNAPSWI